MALKGLGLLLLSAMLASCVNGRVYERCDLARELRYTQGIPSDELPIWMCISYHESRYDTAAVGTASTDGSIDNGLYQINNRYWCSPPGTGCGIPCESLLDDNISDDTVCARSIKNQQGWSAWTTYPIYCEGQDLTEYIVDCGV